MISKCRLKHVVLAALQYMLMTSICWSADVWSNSMTARQFPGHIGPSTFIMVIAVAALCCDWPWRKRCIFEGKLSVVASVVYISGETLQSAFTKGRVASFYIKHGLHAWMAFVIGLCGILLLSSAQLDPASGIRLKDVPHMFFAIAFAFFIYNHKQPNDYGVNMHWVATAWILIGGFLRLRQNPDGSSPIKESGCAYIMAAYTFSGGQLGLTLWAARNSANPGSYVLAWHAIPITIIIAYARLFCFASADQHRNKHPIDLHTIDDERDELLSSASSNAHATKTSLSLGAPSNGVLLPNCLHHDNLELGTFGRAPKRG